MKNKEFELLANTRKRERKKEKKEHKKKRKKKNLLSTNTNFCLAVL